MLFHIAFYSARHDIILPLSNPIVGNDGKEMREILVPAGTTTVLSHLRANRDPAVWGPDSLEWKPERYGPADVYSKISAHACCIRRWLSPLPSSVTDAHYAAVYANLCDIPLLLRFLPLD